MFLTLEYRHASYNSPRSAYIALLDNNIFVILAVECNKSPCVATGDIAHLAPYYPIANL